MKHIFACDDMSAFFEKTKPTSNLPANPNFIQGYWVFSVADDFDITDPDFYTQVSSNHYVLELDDSKLTKIGNLPLSSHNFILAEINKFAPRRLQGLKELAKSFKAPEEPIIVTYVEDIPFEAITKLFVTNEFTETLTPCKFTDSEIIYE